MKKINIVLNSLIIISIIVFTVCSFKVKTKSQNNQAYTLSPQAQEEVEEIWIEPVDYTTMTKSQINNRIASLLELIEVTEKWDTMQAIHSQAVEELDLANTCLEENNYLYPYSEEDLLLLSYMIEIEAGASIVTDEEQCLVASVIINRRNQGGINKNLTNPTIKDIINEAGQYAICRYDRSLRRNTFYVDTTTVNLDRVSDRCKENARKVLEGEFTCPENVVFQALFTQGEIYKSFYHQPPFNNTTYFCYGR